MVGNENCPLSPKEIEFWEEQYLQQISYLLLLDREKMFDGLNTKEDIRKDWEKHWENDISDMAVGSERIFYWLFNQLGKPNSAPIGSDLFFETYNAFLHIDVKTVSRANIGDFRNTIFVGDNQNSYKGNIITKGEARQYHGNLPTYYSKNDGTKKICLTYLLVTLYDETYSDILVVALICMPNGELYFKYGDKVLRAGKNPGKIRYNFEAVSNFELLDGEPPRIKIIFWDDEMDEDVRRKMKVIGKHVIRGEKMYSE